MGSFRETLRLTPWILLWSIATISPVAAADGRGPTGPVDRIDPTECHISASPGVVQNVGFDDLDTLIWGGAGCADRYNVYRGQFSGATPGQPAKCHASDLLANSLTTPLNPQSNDGFFYLVTGEANGEEGTPGQSSAALTRPLLGRCDALVRTHILNRLGFGGDEWSRDRLETLGVSGYIAEQLDPSFIDETTNVELNEDLAVLDPPETIQELQGIDIVRGAYGRRQLEQAATVFWTNHFNTFYDKTFANFFFLDPDNTRKRLEATTLHYREMEEFRNVAFNGTFRQLLDASAYSPSMIVYLDTNVSTSGNPNENYSRELMELHTLGVNGGYTDTDVAQMARVFTGWDFCKHLPADIGNPLAPCIEGIGSDTEPDGEWVAHFYPNQHDCGMKILFAGEPEELIIPSTCGNPADGIDDAALALDALAAHPSTKQFVSTKLLQKFVTENPTQAMIDNVLASWNDAGNPQGVGDMRAVLSTVIGQTAFLDPDQFGGKIKTPYEHLVSAFRASRGKTNGTSQVRNYLTRMGHLLHQNPVPTGFAEDGESWLDTNNTLERQNFGADLTDGTGTSFGAAVVTLLQDNGISTSPGNAAAIVDFLIDTIYGGALTPAERQSTIDFLETDDSGAPHPNYNNVRIRQTAGYLLGFAQFQEQ